MIVAIVVVAAIGGVVPAKKQRRENRLIGAQRRQPSPVSADNRTFSKIFVPFHAMTLSWLRGDTMTIPANDNKPRLMTPKEAAAATTMSRVLLARMSKENRFPQPVQIGLKRIAYVRAEVDAWIETAIGARATA